MKNNTEKFTTGIAFGSGGAKGAALIGALKAMEEENIKFDVVAGTSIGSIIGALYAKGYTADDMLSLKDEMLSYDSRAVLALTIGGISLKKIIENVIGISYFSDLTKPFAAVATDLLSGEEVDITDGELPSALAASSAIQPVFGAVKRENRLLVDGAFRNSVPADVVRRLGADVVVSINLSKGVDFNDHIKKALDDMYPENGVPIARRSEACYKFSDLVIEPDLAEFKSSSLLRFDEMYERGYIAAKSKIDEIKAVVNKR